VQGLTLLVAITVMRTVAAGGGAEPLTGEQLGYRDVNAQRWALSSGGGALQRGLLLP
jgi:hypothetical protein